MSARSGIRLAILRGDGIGPEITEATLRVLRAFCWVRFRTMTIHP
jgi:isocitrate/isopropylmalate dehydrogenase